MDTRPIYNRINTLLSEQGLKPSDMLQECGINKNFLSLLKKGDYNPTLDKLTLISDYLKVPVSRLLGGDDTDFYDAELTDLIVTYVHLDDRGKRAVEGLAYSELSRIEREGGGGHAREELSSTNQRLIPLTQDGQRHAENKKDAIKAPIQQDKEVL